MTAFPRPPSPQSRVAPGPRLRPAGSPWHGKPATYSSRRTTRTGPRRSSPSTSSSPAELGRDSLLVEPVGYGGWGVSVELGSGGLAEEVLGVLVELVSAEGEVGRDGGGHLEGGDLSLGVEGSGGLGEALLDVLDGGDGLVGVLEAEEEVGEVVVGAGGVADLDGAVDDLGERDRIRFCRHPGALPERQRRDSPESVGVSAAKRSMRSIVASMSSKVVRGLMVQKRRTVRPRRTVVEGAA